MLKIHAPAMTWNKRGTTQSRAMLSPALTATWDLDDAPGPTRSFRLAEFFFLRDLAATFIWGGWGAQVARLHAEGE